MLLKGAVNNFFWGGGASRFITHSLVTLLCQCHCQFLSCFDISSSISPIDDGFWCVQLRLRKAGVQHLYQLKTA